LSGDLRDALWDKFFTAAPQRQIVELSPKVGDGLIFQAAVAA
jgi:hypothetical protein